MTRTVDLWVYLATHQREAERAAADARNAAEARNAAIRRAVADGWTHAMIAKATGLTRSRVGQLAKPVVSA